MRRIIMLQMTTKIGAVTVGTLAGCTGGIADCTVNQRTGAGCMAGGATAGCINTGCMNFTGTLVRARCGNMATGGQTVLGNRVRWNRTGHRGRMAMGMVVKVIDTTVIMTG